MTKFLTPVCYSVERAQALLADVRNNKWFLFVGDHRPSSNTDVPEVVLSRIDDYYESWRQMVEGRLVQSSTLGVRNLPYVADAVYDQYDDTLDMSTLDWFVVVNAGAYSHVFACLYNNQGANSTVEPDFSAAVASESFLYQTSDGYRWMYLASTASITVNQLGTVDFFPLVPNTSVSAAAVPGAVSTVIVEDGGKLYNNYTSGTFQSSDVRVNAVPTLYQLSNSSIQTTNGYYTGCVMLITSGTGHGQFATVTDFVSTNTGNYANLDAAFPVTPTNGSKFELYPGVVISSDRTQLSNVVARALVNSLASNSVSSVEVLDRGSGFFSLTTASVVANAVVGVQRSANVRPVLPPQGGHGSDQAKELGATTVLVAATLSNTEGGTIPASNDYKRVGLVRNPQWANVNVTLSGAVGGFVLNEDLLFLSLSLRASNCTVNSSTAVLTGDSRSLFDSLFSVGDFVYVTSGSSQFLATVASITNSSSMNLTSNSAFSANSLSLYAVNAVANSIVSNPVTSANVFVTELTAPVTNGLTAYGVSSQVAGTVTAVKRSGSAKGFSTFVQLSAYRVTVLGGTFLADETVTQGTKSATVHSYSGGVLYVSNQSQVFAVPGGNLTGSLSGAVAVPNEALSPELVPGTGSVEYVENVAAVTRQTNQSEAWVVAYEF